jgi:hypothetical protein
MWVIVKEHQLIRSSNLKPITFVMLTPLHVTIFTKVLEELAVSFFRARGSRLL